MPGGVPEGHIQEVQGATLACDGQLGRRAAAPGHISNALLLLVGSYWNHVPVGCITPSFPAYQGT